jgi:predicted DCC family thiol-disulfide oxidoreductase YuxK
MTDEDDFSARNVADSAHGGAENPEGGGDEVCMVYDDSCVMCSAAARWVGKNTDLTLVPGSSSSLPATDLDRSVWLMGAGDTADAKVGEALAVAGILRHSRRWWWRACGAVLSLWGVRHMGNVVYRFVARNRHRFLKTRG